MERCFLRCIIHSEVNTKVHCADNIVQQTCKSWQDVTFKLQKALCRWEHAKSTFYLTTVTFSRISILETSESRRKRKAHNARNLKSYLVALSISCAKICLHSALKKHLICKRFIQTLIVCIP